MTTPRSVVPLGAELGEGPVWIGTDRALWCVDIKRRKLYRWDPASDALTHWDAPAQPGWVIPIAGGGLAVGLQSGLHRFDPADGTFTLLTAPEPALPGNRLNDASSDAAGRLWFGSMDDGERAPTGRLYRWQDGVVSDAGLPPLAIPNGPAVSPDATTLYPVDTLARTIWQVPIDAAGELGAPRVFATIEDGAGHPDGAVCDAEGCVWVGLWGGWAIRRYDPQGRLMRTVAFPVANVTKLAFGGDDLSIAYATTARKGLTVDALAAQPLAGNVFAFDPGVRGVAVTPIRL